MNESQTRVDRPIRRTSAALGIVALLLQLVAAAPVACASMSANEPDSREAVMAHGGSSHSVIDLHGDPAAHDADDHQDHESPVACAMMTHCTSWVPALDVDVPATLQTRGFVAVYAPAWHLHLAPPTHLVPPPKI